MPQQGRCPVTVLTGFLGSGKTTILNALVRERRDLRIAVIVNEFGELGIDAGLIEASEDDVIQLSNGCLCCSVRGDLLSASERLAARRSEFDWMVVETSGLADPAPVVSTFLLEDGPGETFRMDGLVTLVDARNAIGQMQRNDVAIRQVALADRILVSKTDLVGLEERDLLTERLRSINVAADIIQSSADAPATSALLGLAAYELGSMSPKSLLAPAFRHDDAIISESFHFTRPFDFTAFSTFLKQLVSTRNEDILRVKGIVDLAGEDRRFAFHAVQALIDGDVVGPWEAGTRSSRLVFIGRNLDRPSLEAALVDCLA